MMLDQHDIEFFEAVLQKLHELDELCPLSNLHLTVQVHDNDGEVVGQFADDLGDWMFTST